MMTNTGYIISNVVGGMVGGAIGAAAGKDSDSPVLKGAVVTGLISGGIAAVLVAVSLVDTKPKQVGTSGKFSCLEQDPRFP